VRTSDKEADVLTEGIGVIMVLLAP